MKKLESDVRVSNIVFVVGKLGSFHFLHVTMCMWTTPMAYPGIVLGVHPIASTIKENQLI